LKEEALDRTMWRNRFGGGFGPVVRQNTEWMNEWLFEIASADKIIFDLFFSNVNIRSEDDQNASRNGNRTYWITDVLTERKFGICSDVRLVYSINAL